jgi:hypothetical protein
MQQFLLSTPAQTVIWLSVLAILVAIGGFIVGRFRGRSDEERLTANDLLTNFREMHHRGDIADKEFRNIKTVLGSRLQKELNVAVDEGSGQQTESVENPQPPADVEDSDR